MRTFWYLPVCLCLLTVSAVATAEDLAAMRTTFGQPPREYSSAPFWVWNDLITEQQITDTLQAFADQGVKQVICHPRPGLMTPYLSADWWRLWHKTLQEAKRLDMNVWIYDENSYPSGFAGGFVPEAMPESRGLGLVYRNATEVHWNDNMLAAFQKKGESYDDITAAAKGGKAFENGEFLIVAIEQARKSPWFGNRNYVDLLHPGVTEKFLEITLDAYHRETGDEWGKRVPGSFTDEPHLCPVGQLHWTPDLPQQFQQRHGYNLLENLPALLYPVGDWKRVRHDYYQTLLELFIERWSKPYYNYCTKNGIEFTGHVWEHDWPITKSAPDNMAMYIFQQRPAIDILFNQPFNPGPHSQVGNVRACLELCSAARQAGNLRTLCEAYGGAGWDARFEDFKRIADWICVLGVNTVNQHLSHISMRGARKRDYPPSFGYQATWWDAYHVQANYITRLSYALTRGKQDNKVLLIEPTSTAWMYQGEDQLDQLGDDFQKLVTSLANAQVEMDLGSEDTIARLGSIDKDTFVVGQCKYAAIIIAQHNENLNTKTATLLKEFAGNGGKIFCCDKPVLARIDGITSPDAAPLTQSWTTVSPEDLPETLSAFTTGSFAIRRDKADTAMLFHHRRIVEGGSLVFLANFSTDTSTAGVIQTKAKSAEMWDLHSGKMYAYPTKATGEGIEMEYTIPPYGSLLLFLSDETTTAPAIPISGTTPISASGKLEVTRNEPNSLLLDYIDLKAGKTELAGIPFYKAAEAAFAANGLERNPWDHAIQFKDEYLKLTFPKDSGFTASYRFNIAEKLPAVIWFVVERPDIYTITCNGKPVTQKDSEWWLDRSFGKINIADVVQLGENIITIKAEPFTVFHELEAAYVIGDFNVRPADKGFDIIPAQALTTGPWNTQGCPFYGHSVTYKQTFDITSPDGPYTVSLPEWYGSVARINVNGKTAGYIYCKPYTCDVTGLLTQGTNTIEVTVYGTPRNTVGPHHGNPGLGLSAPDSWDSAPDTLPAGTEYTTIGYGLFKPFELLAAK